MSKKTKKRPLRIRQDDVFRVLLTEVAPYETPINFSNWGAYNYFKTLHRRNPDPLMRILKFPQESQAHTVPYKYRIRKDSSAFRPLSLVHPKHSTKIIEIYRDFDVHIIKACKKSAFSIRRPHSMAKCYVASKTNDANPEEVEEVNENTPYASSYFRYERYSHLYKFFESEQLTELEKTYSHVMHLDIGKCFPSIYTHTISWALKGKVLSKRHLYENKRHYAKNPPFDTAFDKLMQVMNYNETHGIPIGPELSRIFAEIILQFVDSSIEDRMLTERNFSNRKDYACLRFIDDFFVFFNKSEIASEFKKFAGLELDAFRLYLNDAKTEIKTRPFISNLSSIKIKLSAYIDEIATDPRRDLKPGRVLNNVRMILMSSPEGMSGACTFFIKTIRNKIERLKKKSVAESFNLLYVYMELASYSFRLEPSVAPSYEFSRLVLGVLKLLDQLAPEDSIRLLDKIKHDLRMAISHCSSSGYSIECLNLLILCAEDKLNDVIDETRFSVLMDSFLEHAHVDEQSGVKRLSYLELVSLLYVTKAPHLVKFKDHIYDDCIAVIASQNPAEYAECVYLLLDCCSCPMLTNSQKKNLAGLGLKHTSKGPVTSHEIDAFLAAVDGRSWFFNWNSKRDLSSLLKKKQLQLSY